MRPIKFMSLYDLSHPISQMILFIYTQETFLFDIINERKAFSKLSKETIENIGPFIFVLTVIL